MSVFKKWHFLDLVCSEKSELIKKIRMHPAQPCFGRPGGVHNKFGSCLSSKKNLECHAPKQFDLIS